MNVVEFQGLPGGASKAAPRRHEATPAAIPLPNGSPDLGGDVPRTRGPCPRGPGPTGGCDLLARKLGDQRRQRAIEDGGDVAARYIVSQQLLSLAQLAIGLGTGREADLISFRGQRRSP